MGTFKECSKNADIPPCMSLKALVHKVPHFKAVIVKINGSSRKGRGSTFT